jgi:hypothetical protein
LVGEDLVAQGIPALVELALDLVDPLFGGWCSERVARDKVLGAAALSRRIWSTAEPVNVEQNEPI